MFCKDGAQTAEDMSLTVEPVAVVAWRLLAALGVDSQSAVSRVRMNMSMLV